MALSTLNLPQNHKAVVNRFITLCHDDQRIVAAFLGGSYAAGKADRYSDLDLFLITTDAAYEAFMAEKESFVHLLGEPLFLENFGLSDGYLFIFADGTEGELWIGRESHFTHMYGGAYTVLLDKQSLLAGVEFPMHTADPAEQIETLRQQLAYFWHDMFHFVKAMGRKQLWFAYGELEVLRRICLNLARAQHNFADPELGEEPHFKIEQALSPEQLAPLQATCCPLEYQAMLQAGMILFQFYRDLAPGLAQEHGLPYQVELERLVTAHLEGLNR